MHAILVTIGTSGDVLPYLGLGSKLRARGHRVTLAACAIYEEQAARLGLEFRELISSGENHALLGNPDFWHPVKTVTHAAKWGVPLMERQYNLLAGLASQGDTLFVANPGVFAAAMVREKFRRPLASIVLQPGIIPSIIAPPALQWFVFPPSTPRVILRLFWRTLDAVGDFLVSRTLNRLRNLHGLKPVRRIFQHWLSPDLVISMFPEWYGPPPPDWPLQMKLVGFPLFDGSHVAEAGKEALDFCANGPPPLCFTFGTGFMHAHKLFRAGMEACEQTGQRAIFLTPHRDQLPANLPPTILACAHAPFRDLFPRCAAVVHHGGVGTAASAMAAGVPQLILPVCFDQTDNGMRVRKLGAGGMLKSRRATGARIASLLAQLLQPDSRARCQAIAKKLADRSSLEKAADCIEELAARTS